MFSLRQFYHATSYENAVKIISDGFKKGEQGMFGPGIYFAEKPEGALNKAHCQTLDTLVIVVLNAGRLLTETKSHRDWNLSKINKLGYDSVEMRTCKTGPEICLYENERVQVICIVHWDQTKIKFLEVTGLNVDLSDLQFLIKGKQLIIEKYGSSCSGIFPKKLTYNNQNNLCGILNFIRNTNLNLVDITVSSYCTKDHNNWPQNIMSYENLNTSFATDDLPNQWICFDFKNHYVVLKNYTIRSSHFGPNLSHLKSWVIEGSNNLAKWIVIDEQQNCPYLNGSNNTCSFSIYNPNDDSYRYLRLRQTGPNWRNRNYLKLNCIEFFGEIL